MTMKGQVTKVIDDPGYINCTVQLAQPMPPSGTQVNVQVNSVQVEKQGGGEFRGGNPPKAPEHGEHKK